MCSKRKKASVAVMSKEGTERVAAIAAKSGATDGGDPDHDPGLSHSWISRILRAALPFQLALVALFYAASLLEPHCCEATNTLNLSLTPQLRYVRGPPPVWTPRRPIVSWISLWRGARAPWDLHGIHRSDHRRNLLSHRAQLAPPPPQLRFGHRVFESTWVVIECVVFEKERESA